MCIYDLLPGSSWAYRTNLGKNNKSDGRTRMEICLDAISRVLDVEEDDGVKFGECDPILYPGLESRRGGYWTDDEESQTDEDDGYQTEDERASESVWPHDQNSCSYWVEDGASQTIAEGIRWPLHVQSRLGKWTRESRY